MKAKICLLSGLKPLLTMLSCLSSPLSMWCQSLVQAILLMVGFPKGLPESPSQTRDRAETFWVLKAMSKGEWVAIVHRSLSASGRSQRMAVISDVSGVRWRFSRLAGKSLSGSRRENRSAGLPVMRFG